MPAMRRLFGAWGGLGWMSGIHRWSAGGNAPRHGPLRGHACGRRHDGCPASAPPHGRAQHVDLAAREVASAMIGDALVLASLGVTPMRPGNRHLAMAPHGVYPTGQPDRWLTLAVRSDAEWQALMRELDQPAASGDPRFATAAARLQHGDELDALLAQWLSAREADVIGGAPAACRRLRTCFMEHADIAGDPHLRARGATTEVRRSDIPQRIGRRRAGALLQEPIRWDPAIDAGVGSGRGLRVRRAPRIELRPTSRPGEARDDF